MSEVVGIMEVWSSSGSLHVSMDLQNLFQWLPEVSEYMFVGTLLGRRGSGAQTFRGVRTLGLFGLRGFGSLFRLGIVVANGRSSWRMSDCGNRLVVGAAGGPSIRGAAAQGRRGACADGSWRLGCPGPGTSLSS